MTRTSEQYSLADHLSSDCCVQLGATVLLVEVPKASSARTLNALKSVGNWEVCPHPRQVGK